MTSFDPRVCECFCQIVGDCAKTVTSCVLRYSLIAPDQDVALQQTHNDCIHQSKKEFTMQVVASPAGVFEYLDATHRQIDQRLKLLRQMVDGMVEKDLDAQGRLLAREILVFFNTEARQHHLDEEKHIFPALLASPLAEVSQAAMSLTQDHGWLEENWLVIEPMIEAAADGNNWFDMAELLNALEVFEALYQDHIVLEESLAYPAAREALADKDTSGAGREMARRRALQAKAAD